MFSSKTIKRQYFVFVHRHKNKSLRKTEAFNIYKGMFPCFFFGMFTTLFSSIW